MGYIDEQVSKGGDSMGFLLGRAGIALAGTAFGVSIPLVLGGLAVGGLVTFLAGKKCG